MVCITVWASVLISYNLLSAAISIAPRAAWVRAAADGLNGCQRQGCVNMAAAASGP